MLVRLWVVEGEGGCGLHLVMVGHSGFKIELGMALEKIKGLACFICSSRRWLSNGS